MLDVKDVFKSSTLAYSDVLLVVIEPDPKFLAEPETFKELLVGLSGSKLSSNNRLSKSIAKLLLSSLVFGTGTFPM